MLESCGSLINPDGALTSAGYTAVGCVTNEAIITLFATQFNMPLDTIKNILGGLAGPTGCSGIVNVDQIQTSSCTICWYSGPLMFENRAQLYLPIFNLSIKDSSGMMNCMEKGQNIFKQRYMTENDNDNMLSSRKFDDNGTFFITQRNLYCNPY